MNKKFLDKRIYQEAKKKIDKQHERHSIYKSMALIKLYKEKGGRIDEGKTKKGTSKWLNEKWKNLTGVALGKMSIKDAPACGIKYKNQDEPTICRPTKKIDANTPKLAQSYNRNQLFSALQQKKKGKTIRWNEL